MAALNQTPGADRIQIAFFGRRNAGKSSLVNAFTGQKMSVVSDFGGTTTDTVKKAMELLPMGSVVIIDTPGFDDEGELGKMRVAAAKKALESIDAAVLVCDGTKGIGACEKQLVKIFDEHNTPYIIAYNKCDLCCKPQTDEKSIAVFAFVSATGLVETSFAVRSILLIEMLSISTLLSPLVAVVDVA